jgi:uncharacterized delta-60 repeat protein
MARSRCKSHFALFFISFFVGAVGHSRGQVIWETADSLEQTFPIDLSYVYSDRHGRVFLAYTGSTGLVTNNDAGRYVKQFPLAPPVTVQPDGGVVGRADRTRVVNRCLPGGTIDVDFVAPQVNDGDTDSFLSIAAQPDGKLIVACGPLPSGVSPFDGINQGLFRLNADGSFDPTFHMAKGPIRQLSVLPDGRFYGLSSGSLIRFQADGTIDPTFGPAQLTSFTGPVDYDLQPDGKIVVVGSFYSANGSVSPDIARFTTSGGFDFTFAREPKGFSALTGVRVQSDGSVFITNGGQLAKLLPNGTLDPNFPVIRTTNRLGGIGVDATDRVYFDDGSNSFYVYSGRLRVRSLATVISTTFEQSSSVSGPWTALIPVPPNAIVDFPVSANSGNAFFRLQPTQ